jgi:hypothetical protein
MTAPKPQPRQSKQLDAKGFQPEISSFRLHLAAQGKARKTVRTYTQDSRHREIVYAGLWWGLTS